MNILLTGGASGLGEAITRIFAKDKNNKIFFTYSESSEKAKEIELSFENTHSIKCNFKNTSEIKELIKQIASFNCDVLINNAYTGKVISTHFHKIPTTNFEADFTNNIIPTILITQAVIKHFRKQKKGKIITILSSALVNTPPIGGSCYTANKAYLQSLVKSWASENVKFNITSNSISPNFMQTALTSGIDERIVEQMIANHPLKKLLTVHEVAETVLSLAKASSQVNGVDILINSGTNIR